MLTVQRLTADTLQKQVVILPDGSQATLTLCFVPLQQCWFLQEIDYGAFTLYNLKITTNPNMLQQYKNQLTFGLQCQTNDGQEPKLQQDFSSGYATLYVLTAAEVTQLAGLYGE